MLADVMNGQDIGMVQRRGRARFLLEAREALRVGRECGGENFDGDVSSEAVRRLLVPDVRDPLENSSGRM